ncbi:MAG: hypothetical protein EOM31_05530 [Bacteroidia bacterium]|nr:hypothetical protein [Bacteroidia bacterium]
MKQIKFFMVALTLLMGVSLTSCLNSDGNTVVPVRGIITLKNIYPYEFQAEGSSVVYVADKATIPGLSEMATPSDIVLLDAQYDTKTQAVDQNTKKINVTVTYAEKINENALSTPTDEEPNRSILPLSSLGSNLTPGMYSTDFLIMPIPFYTEKQESLKLHRFYLCYDKEASDKLPSTMVLRLRHLSSESDVTKEKAKAALYKAFNISPVVFAYSTDHDGAKPKEIKVITQEQSGNTPEIKPGSTENYTEETYTIDYSKYTK